jgi:hypothetical protein
MPGSKVLTFFLFATILMTAIGQRPYIGGVPADSKGNQIALPLFLLDKQGS